MFDRIPMLQKLYVSLNTQLRKIDKDAFSNLKHLIILDLRKNCLEFIDKSHFSNLTKLKTLGNPLNYIKGYVFSNLKSLRHLWLNNIQLTSLGSQSLAGLKN